jgi:solute carrier family 25 aspartate/glutamate transporter 12/13
MAGHELTIQRLQNQRSNVVGEALLYKGPIDCAKKIYLNEGGVRGFYRGVLPQLVGVAPEKAIKLTINDFVRKLRTDPETGRITLTSELMAGFLAGSGQVVSCIWR